MLAVSAGLSADLSAGFSAADFSRMAFSEMPFALTPGSGMLATPEEVSDVVAVSGAPLASAFGSVVETAAATGASAPGLVTM